MSLSVVYTRAALGVTAPLITVEVHISQGLPGLTMVGLPETTVKEARDRVRSAIINSGYEYPAKKITVNLAPADLPKEGGDMIYLSLSRFWRPLSSSIHRSWVNTSLWANLRLQVHYAAFPARFQQQLRRIKPVGRLW